MSTHIERDDLLGYGLELLEPAQRSEIRAHLATCRRCRDELAGVSTMLDEAAATPDTKVGQRPDALRRIFESTWTPVIVMGLSLLASGVPWLFSSLATVAPLLAGAAFVAWWIHRMVSRVETDWRSVVERRWDESLDSADRLRVAEGIKLSVLQSLRVARGKIAAILSLSLVLFIVSGTLTFAALRWIPEAAAVTSSRPALFPGALALGVVMGGVVLSSWRLKRITESVADFLGAVTKEAKG